MGERRMFAKTITESDAFRDMPLSSQALYFHINMAADDDGFCNKPKAIARCIGASEDDLKLLIAKKFLIAFEDGVVVIKHWKVNNYIPKDRYKKTIYQEHFNELQVKEDNGYTLVDSLYTGCIQSVSTSQVKLSKDKISKDKLNDDYKNNIYKKEIQIGQNLYSYDSATALLEILKKELGETEIPEQDLKWIAFKIYTSEVYRIANLKAYILKALED